MAHKPPEAPTPKGHLVTRAANVRPKMMASSDSKAASLFTLETCPTFKLENNVATTRTVPSSHSTPTSHPTLNPPFCRLPSELHLTIFDHLDRNSLLNLHETNRFFYHLIGRKDIIAAYRREADRGLQIRMQKCHLLVCLKCIDLADINYWTGRCRKPGPESTGRRCVVCLSVIAQREIKEEERPAKINLTTNRLQNLKALFSTFARLRGGKCRDS